MRKVAVIVPNNSYGQGVADEFKKRFAALGGTVVADIRYTEGQSSYRRELQQVQRAAPDGFVYSAYGQEAATINREAFQLGMNTKPWYGIYLTMCTSDTPAEIAKGQIGLEVASSGPKGKTYEDAYRAKYHEGVKSSFGSYAYDAVMLSADAINTAKSDDPAKIRAAFATVGKGYDGVTGPITFDSDGQRTVQPYLKVKVDGTGVVPR
jgi:branched-chain amino acid transport system substrate-binding protein